MWYNVKHVPTLFAGILRKRLKIAFISALQGHSSAILSTADVNTRTGSFAENTNSDISLVNKRTCRDNSKSVRWHHGLSPNSSLANGPLLAPLFRKISVPRDNLEFYELDTVSRKRSTCAPSHAYKIQDTRLLAVYLHIGSFSNNKWVG